MVRREVKRRDLILNYYPSGYVTWDPFTVTQEGIRPLVIGTVMLHIKLYEFTRLVFEPNVLKVLIVFISKHKITFYSQNWFYTKLKSFIVIKLTDDL